MGRRKTKLSQLYAIACKTQTSILACPVGVKELPCGYVRSWRKAAEPGCPLHSRNRE
jgi:hypothetical protein